MAPIPPATPLTGVTVLDFTRHLSGPFTTMILRDLESGICETIDSSTSRPCLIGGIGAQDKLWEAIALFTQNCFGAPLLAKKSPTITL